MAATKAALAWGGITHRLHPPGLEAVFLSVVRTSSRLIGGTASSSTTRSASSRRLQRAWPAGGGGAGQGDQARLLLGGELRGGAGMGPALQGHGKALRWHTPPARGPRCGR